ncbi:uncharacterized protein BX664DRAFT_327875 [Halteromyces radiatus]|uniref:uncharacterized protein n=1 Tax=Halteromyces radiatus TaxID=101107 RepID=UPI00221F0C27|nr:uncharacterized protein BX664DRAFT_327875 [Halteromyces radiatus]KAI8092672.1 hypothetical protein BX664DRAFT_327875 [Halteromyces radiatus]
MGNPKDYVALPTSEEKALPTSSSSSFPPPPPYEQDGPRQYSLRWKLIFISFIAIPLLLIGIYIRPASITVFSPKQSSQVDLGFPQDMQQVNLAQNELISFMTHLVEEIEHGTPCRRPHEKSPHNGKHHDHPHRKHHHHGYHGNHDHEHPPHSLGNSYDGPEHPHHDNHPHHGKYLHHHGHEHPPHYKHHHHHHHHRGHEHSSHGKSPQHDHEHRPQDNQHEKRQNEDGVFVQKLPTHNRYQPPHRNQRRGIEFPSVPKWRQRYEITSSTNASMRIHVRSGPFPSGLTGNVNLRQDTTGVQKDIIVTLSMDDVDYARMIRLSTHSSGDAFSLRVFPQHDIPPASFNYSLDIVFPSGLHSMDSLYIKIDNGTVNGDDSLKLAFKSVTLAAAHGTILTKNLKADRIMLGAYSGTIEGSYQPTEQFAVGVFHGHSDIHLFSSPNRTDHLHIASGSPHGVAKLSLAHGSFEGQFIAKQCYGDVPTVNFTVNDGESYVYDEQKDSPSSGWYLNDTNAGQLIISARDNAELLFE